MKITDSTLSIDVNGIVGETSYVAVATIMGMTGITDGVTLEIIGNLIA